MKTGLLVLYIFVLSTTVSVAQKKLADKFFDNYGYTKAIELYEKVVKKGDSSTHVLTRLGDSYYNNSKSEQAAKWYALAIEDNKKIEPEYIFKYIQSLRSIGKYDEADKWFKEFKAMQEGDSRIKGYDPDEVDIYDKLGPDDKVIVTIKNEDFNTEYSDFGGYIFNNTLYFASARNTENDIYKWTNEPYLDIYTADLSKEDTDKAEETIAEKTIVNALNFSERRQRDDIHEGTVCITRDGTTMYFTRDNVTKRNRLGFDKDGTSHLKIYRAKLVDNQWSDITELPFNDILFSSGNPALSSDNSKLYFVSDREGGFGQTDIYYVDINADGTYGEPVNLGDKVNSEGREMFPFVSSENILYFSSDGYLNLGLLDIFKSNILNGDTSEPLNLGAPYNSGYDDFAYYVNEETKLGYFSSNRLGGKGGDDIYSFNAYICKQTIEGIVKDSKTNEIIAAATVRLVDTTGKVIAEALSDGIGVYSFEADCDKVYTVVGSKPDYKGDQKQIITSKENEKVNTADLMLVPLIIDNQIVIDPIFFDFAKSNIRTDAQYELENIVEVLRKHPTMVIKIESHTDSRGRDRYNMKLSDRRAKSTKDYLLSRDVAAERIESAIGYGETQLLNKCSNKVKCSKEEHQLNRRSYFYILKD